MTKNFFQINLRPLLFALLSALLYWVFAYDLERSDFPKLISLVAALFFITYYLIKSHGWNFWLLAGMGVLFRLLFLPSIPNLSQDFYRFLWDGRLLLQGVNPYLFTPQDLLEGTAATMKLTVAQSSLLYEGMGSLNGSHYSNYPPVNQLCFALAALVAGKSIWGSAMVLRILIILADVGILYFGKKLLKELKLPVKKIFWYFLNPFIIIEMTGNLHFESVMLFFVVWALYLLYKRKWILAAFLLGISVSVKLLPLLFLPLFLQYFAQKEGAFFWKRYTLPNLGKLVGFYTLTLTTVLLTFAPFLSAEFISNFAATIGLWFQTFEFNASVYYIIRWIGFQTIGWNIIADVGKILPIIVIAFLLALTFFRRNQSMQEVCTALLFGVSFYFLLSTTVHPWYIATPLVLSLFTRYRFPILWSAVVMLSYSAYGAQGFNENLWLVALEYVVVVLFAFYELFPKLFSSKNKMQYS